MSYYFRGQATPTIPGTLYVGLYTTTPVIAGSGGTEVSGNAYARQSLGVSASGIWSAPSAGAMTNSNTVTFPQSTGSWGLVKSIGIFDAVSAGNLVWIIPMVTGSYKDFETNDTSTGVLQCPSHGFTTGQQVRFFAEGGTLPTGLSTDTVYFVTATSNATNTFTVAATSGGSVIVPSAAGAGTVIADASFTIPTNATLSFAAGQISIAE